VSANAHKWRTTIIETDGTVIELVPREATAKKGRAADLTKTVSVADTARAVIPPVTMIGSVARAAMVLASPTK